MNKMERIVSQISSGRWLLTQAAAICLILLVATDCYVAVKHPEAKIPFSVEGIVALISSVFVSYFSKKDEEPVVPQDPKG